MPEPAPVRLTLRRASVGVPVEAWMISSTPLLRRQMTVGAPSGPIAICGSTAFCPVADRSTVLPKSDAPAGRVRAWMMVFTPSERRQVPVVAPSGPTAI